MKMEKEYNYQHFTDSLLFQLLITQAGHSISIAEREGDETILIYANKAFEEMTGYSADEILYKDCWFLQKEEKHKTRITKIRSAMKKRKSIRTELQSYRKNGEMFWSDITIQPHFHENDGVLYYIFVQKEVANSIKKENDNLIKLILKKREY